MKFKVRSKEDGGVLDFDSFGQVEQAWLLGLIDPEDELLEEGKTVWRKAGAVPLLVSARRSGDEVWKGTWFAWTLIGVIGGTVALVLLGAPGLTSKAIGVVVAFIFAGLMIKVSQDAWQRRKPH
jgi:hypothetical protein